MGICIRIHKKFLRNQKSAITQKLSRILKLWSLRVQPQLKVLQKKTDHFYLVFSSNLFFYVHRMAQLLLRFGWPFINLKTLPRPYNMVDISLKLWKSIKIAPPKKIKVLQNTQYLSQSKNNRTNVIEISHWFLLVKKIIEL